MMPNDQTRVFVCSDIHVDQHGNISWCQNMNASEFINDVLLVAGDCGDTMNAIKQVRACGVWRVACGVCLASLGPARSADSCFLFLGTVITKNMVSFQRRQSADSCFLFLVTSTQCWTRNMVVKRGSQRHITFIGVNSTTDKQTTALSTPMNVFWRWLA